MCRRVITLFHIFLLCGGASVAVPVPEADASRICLRTASAAPEVGPQVAQARKVSGIVSQTRDSIRFATGYTLRIEKRGRSRVVKVTTSGSAQAGYVSCSCTDSGSCWPKVSHGEVICVVNDYCNGSCKIKLTAPPPPPPNP